MAIRLFKNTTNIDFIGLRNYAYVATVIVLFVGLLAMVMNKGLHYGVDFVGGVMVQIEFAEDVKDENVKKALEEVRMPGLTVQKIGDGNKDYMLRFSATKTANESLRSDVTSALAKAFPDNTAQILQLNMVGPKVGDDLKNMAIEALFYSILLITVYISGRFEHSWFMASGIAVLLWGSIFVMDSAAQWFDITWFNKIYAVGIAMLLTIFLAWKVKLNFALGALLALVHDVVATLGLLTLLGKEIDLNVIAALLTLIGYSLNDNIVVYDRIRENLQAIKSTDKKPTMGEIINISVNQTLARTIMTSLTTMFACLSLYLLGGTVIHDFALTMLIGIVVGTFSSIFVASPILMTFGDVDLYLKQQEKEETFEKPGQHGVV